MNALHHHGGSARMATLFVTAECDRACQYCYAIDTRIDPKWSWDRPTLDRLLDGLAARGYRASLGGGEPLLHPETTLRLARAIATRGLGTALLTNGRFLSAERLAELAAAGVDWIQISADSLPELRKLAPALRAGRRAGLRMAIGTVLMPRRVPELKAMHDLLADCGAAGWRILRHTPLSEEDRMGSDSPDTAVWIRMLLELERQVPPDSPVQIRYEPSVAPRSTVLRTPRQERLDVCGGWSARRLFLYADGSAVSCGLPCRSGIGLPSFRSDWTGFLGALDTVPDEARRTPAELPADEYCQTECRGGCLQQRQDRPCDPRCVNDEGLVPQCCFEKLLLTPGRRPGAPTPPSRFFAPWLTRFAGS